MSDTDFAELLQINEMMTPAENTGDRKTFEGWLTSELAFRRADGSVVGRDTFLASMASGGKRTCDPRSIKVTPMGRTCAVVTCTIEMPGRVIENTRLFIKAPEGWRLLGWANEEK